MIEHIFILSGVAAMKKFEKKTVYIYEINGKEKVTITSPEEASRWDAIFEIAERLDTVIQNNPPDLGLDENQRTDLSIYLAQNREGLLAAFGEQPPSAEDSNDKATESSAEKPKTASENGMKKQSFVQEFKRPVPPSKDGFSL